MQKNILICGENLDDGGVETAIVNEAIVLKEQGNNVYVLAKEGIYSQILKENNVEIIDMEFEFVNGFDMEKAEKIVRVIKEKAISEAHIHKFISIPACLPAMIICGIPYIVYLHEGLPISYYWVMNSYELYKDMLDMYLKNAYKIITITESVKQYNMNLFNIPEEKYIVINNSVNIDMFKISDYTHAPIKKFLLISRLAEEKVQSIKNGIELFVQYNKKVKSKMRIAGGGKALEELEQYVKRKKYKNIEFIGKTSKIAEEIYEADIVLGMGRCIVEAMASKKLCCIIGYDALKPIIKEENILKAQEENFSGRGLDDKSVKDLVKELNRLKINDINNIVNSNFKHVKDKLDIRKNIYTINSQEKINYYDIIKCLFKILDRAQKERDKSNKESNEIWNAKVWIEEQLNNERAEKNRLLEENTLLKEKLTKKKRK